MKTILSIFLLIPYIIFSQEIPTKSKILNITYDKPKGTKIEKEKDKNYPKKRTGHSFEFSLGLTTFWDKERWANYIPNNLNISWQKKWGKNIHSALNFSSSYIDISKQQESEKSNDYLHSIGTAVHYYLITSDYWHKLYSSPYLLAGLNVNYNQNLTPKLFLGIGLGLGYRLNLNRRIDLFFEYKINHFTINQEKFWLNSFQLGVTYNILQKIKKIYKGGLFTPHI